MRTPSLLVADDDRTVRQILQRLLSGHEWRIVVAKDGEEALRFLEGSPHDLLLADIRMPGLDGIQLARKARKLRPETDIILMTGLPSLDAAIDDLKDSLHDYVIKPFSPQILLSVLQRWRKAWELRQALSTARSTLDAAMKGMLAALDSLQSGLPAGAERDKARAALDRARQLADLVGGLRP